MIKYRKRRLPGTGRWVFDSQVHQEWLAARWFAECSLDVAPLKSQKKSVKQFDLEGVTCDKVGSLFINDVRECKADAGAPPDCLQKLTVSTLSTVQLMK